MAADENPRPTKNSSTSRAIIFPTYRDPATKDQRSPIARSYGTAMIPETYIIDRHGKIARKFIGLQQWDSPDMLAYFDTLLGPS